MTRSSSYYSEYRRLHPLTLLYRAIMAAPQLLIVLYFAVFQKSVGDWIYILIFVIFAFFTFPFILLNYYYFQFLISDEEIIIKSGVFSRQQRNIPLEKIQNVEITRNFLQRLLGLAKITIETAGAAQTEGQLEFITQPDAEMIRDIIRNHQTILNRNDIESHKSGSHETQDRLSDYDTPKKELLIKMTIKDVLIHGMLRFRPVVLILIFWLYSMAQQFYIIPDFEKMDYSGFNNFLNSLNPLSLAIYVVVFILVVSLTSWIIDILLSLNKFYGFQINLEGDKLHTEHGLLNTRKGIIPLRKLQMIVNFTNPIRKMFGYWGMMLETAGLGDKNKAAETAVPFIKEARIIELTSKLRSFKQPEKFNPISKKAIRRAFVRYLLISIPPLVMLYLVYPGVIWLILLVPLLYYAAFLRYQFRGYFIANDTILVKQGFWFQRVSIIPIEKIQTLSVTKSFFQRRLDLASLHIDTASSGYRGVASIVDIDSTDAAIIMNELNNAFKDYYKNISVN